ncbi:MAG: biphenyl-2,3-diol 1,2-dioxygenase [Rugosibacter sp.]|nr:MAG: biphenyl-2,3-diol 1,2-dioxygenase [Rugosibacter sp.]
MSIKNLGYLGFGVKDVQAWRTCLAAKLGLMETSYTDGNALFRMDSRAWRIAVHPGEEDDLAYTGYEVANAAALAQMTERLRQAGVTVTMGDAALAKRRGVVDLISFTDPFDLTIELYYGATDVFEQPFVSTTGVSGFLTGAQGLGHIVRCVPDAIQTLDFYTKVLGFELSDIIDLTLGPDMKTPLYFLHCNERHHTFAIAALPVPKKIHHFMLEALSLDDVGFAYDRLGPDNVITTTLGRHTNDHMFSFYSKTPSGIEVEFGWGARTVDDTWSVTRHNSTSMWGHKPVGKGA